MADPALFPRSQRFGPFEFDLRAGELRKQGRRINLRGQPLEVLALLLEHAGEVTSRDELRARLWPADTFVDFDHSLNAAVNKLREALGDSAENRHFIETIPRRGYRFIAVLDSAAEQPTVAAPELQAGPTPRSVRRSAEPTETASRFKFAYAALLVLAIAGVTLLALNAGRLRDRLWSRIASPPIRAIAVLPLANLSRDEEQEFFADGMTEALITNLGKIGALRVISHTSVARYKNTKKPVQEIAREVDVDAVIEGTVARSGGRVRITANLIQAFPEKHLWAESYERELSDVLVLQRDLASSIADEVEVKLTATERARIASARPVNPAAYQAYLRGRHFWNKRTKEDLEKAVRYFDEAIAKDLNYAPAYAGLADSYLVMGAWDLNVLPPEEAFPKARDATVKALALDDGLAEAHTSRAAIGDLYDWDRQTSEKEFKRAIELNPGYATAHQWYGLHLAQNARFEEAIAESLQAEKLDPLSLMISASLGHRLYLAHRYDEAIAQLQRTLEMDPNFFHADAYLGQAYEQKGMYAQAIQEFQKAIAESGRNPIFVAALGHAYALACQRNEALKALDELKHLARGHYVSAYNFAILNAGLGRYEQALADLEQAGQEHSTLLVNLKVDPRLDALRTDPRFQDLLRHVGFPP